MSGEQIQYELNESLLKKIENSKKPNKLLYYSQLKNDKKPEIKQEKKWEKIHNNNLIEWKNNYTRIFKTTIDTKMRSFQYKFIMNIVPTNAYLYKCRLANSTLCDFCSRHEETIEHIFWKCNHIQALWNNLVNFLKEKNITLTLSFQDICFGVKTSSINTNAINFMILVMKYYIMQMKFRKQLPIFLHYKNYLKIRIKIEQEIAFINNKIQQHNKKWSFLFLA